MTIVICGSIYHYDLMKSCKQELELHGHTVIIPPNTIQDEQGNPIPVEEYMRLRKEETDMHSWIWKRKHDVLLEYFHEIQKGDCIFVLNEDKHGVEGYIGGNTLMEMGIALYLQKPIYLYKDIPDISYKEEILAMQPILIQKDLKKMKI